MEGGGGRCLRDVGPEGTLVGSQQYGSCSASFSVFKMLPAASDVGRNLQQVWELWGGVWGSARAAAVPGSPSRGPPLSPCRSISTAWVLTRDPGRKGRMGRG